MASIHYQNSSFCVIIGLTIIVLLMVFKKQPPIQEFIDAFPEHSGKFEGTDDVLERTRSLPDLHRALIDFVLRQDTDDLSVPVLLLELETAWHAEHTHQVSPRVEALGPLVTAEKYPDANFFPVETFDMEGTLPDMELSKQATT
jgi:hypothetical protein